MEVWKEIRGKGGGHAGGSSFSLKRARRYTLKSNFCFVNKMLAVLPNAKHGKLSTHHQVSNKPSINLRDIHCFVSLHGPSFPFGSFVIPPLPEHVHYFLSLPTHHIMPNLQA